MFENLMSLQLTISTSPVSTCALYGWSLNHFGEPFRRLLVHHSPWSPADRLWTRLNLCLGGHVGPQRGVSVREYSCAPLK
jgi:hypothetical protein